MLTCELVTRHVRILPLSAVLLLLGLVGSSEAQRAGRRVATLDLLSEHSSFFHGEEIIVHGEAVGDGVLTYLVSDQDRLLVLDVPPPPPGVSDQLEIIGIFYDVGRLEQGDPRVAELPFERLSRSLLSKAWPSVGEMLLVAARSSTPLTGSPATTLRTVALNPDAHVDQSVTLTGRFRGRNLYGDLPDSPGESRYDFVLTSADAAVWVVGKEPKGDGFELDVQARLDTGRWLEITGTVRLHEGMVVVDAGTIRLAEPVGRSPSRSRTRRLSLASKSELDRPRRSSSAPRSRATSTSPPIPWCGFSSPGIWMPTPSMERFRSTIRWQAPLLPESNHQVRSRSRPSIAGKIVSWRFDS